MKAKLIWHIIFWISIMLVGTATVYPYFGDLNKALINRAIFLPVWWIATYINWYVLMPKFMHKKSIVKYILLLAGVIFAVTVLQRLLCQHVFYPTFWWSKIQIFHPGAFAQFAAFISLPIICSIGIYLLMGWYKESYQAKQIIAQQKEAELSYLKAQINPHFLFNTLNTLYGLSMEESKKVPNLILKLSDLLSYSLYESSAEKISIEKEINLIENFIALETERYSGRMKVDFKKSNNLSNKIEIAPLLLIPIVENAFKHGIKETTEALPISILLDYQNGNLIFEVVNKIPTITDEQPNPKSGLGLKNLERRLALLYPNKFKLENYKKGDRYFAKLNIQIDG